MKTYFSDYAQHCMRFYARHVNPTFRSEADKLNWSACDFAIKTFSNTEQDILLELYREEEPLESGARRLAYNHNLKQKAVWKLIKELEHKVAKKRNLI